MESLHFFNHYWALQHQPPLVQSIPLAWQQLNSLLFLHKHSSWAYQILGQKFLIDVDAWMDLRTAGKSDRLTDTISYTAIYRIVKEVVEGPPHNLLESVAELIASTTLTKYPQISAIRVKVGKPHVAVQGPLDYLGIEILRYGNAPKC